MGGGTPAPLKKLDDTFQKWNKKTANLIDPLVPEGVKESMDKMTPESMKKNMGTTIAGTESPLPETQATADPTLPSKGEQGLKQLNARRRAVARSRSVYSTPLGAGGKANIIRNLLTGK